MKKIYVFYVLMIGINLLPFIPMSDKGILGLLFIIISSVKLGLKSGLHTAILLIIIGVFYFVLGINVDYRDGVIAMIMGSLLYLVIAFYLGGSTDRLRNKNSELKNEIEKRENTEKELKEKITLLHSLMDNLPTPICFKDLECRYIGCNYAFARDFGICEEDLIGKCAHDLFDLNLAETYNKMDIELLKNQERQICETTAIFADGRLRNIIYNKTLLMDEEGNPGGIVGVMLDITDQKESERLKRSIVEEKLIVDEMQKYDKLKTEFFSNISHELRTPLNVIFGAIQLMEVQMQDSQYLASQNKVKRNVASIKQNCLRLLRLVNNLIDITKIDAHAFDTNLKNWNIVYLVEEITLSVSDYVNNKGIKLEFDTDIEEKIIACDDEKIERIILNLLSNAIKFTPIGGSIFVNIFDKGSSVCIQIRDTGIGIPMDRQNEIFQRFYQISPMHTRLHEGSGIGLNLVKSLVEMHEGIISVESEFGKGTTFNIWLPSKLLKEEALQREEFFDKQIRIEKIQLEFSDIYSAYANH